MIYYINEENVIQRVKTAHKNQINRSINAHLDLSKSILRLRINKQCKSIYNSLNKDIQQDLSGVPEYLSLGFDNKNKGLLKVRIRFLSGSNDSKNAFLNKLIPYLESNKSVNPKRNYNFYVDNGQLFGKKA